MEETRWKMEDKMETKEVAFQPTGHNLANPREEFPTRECRGTACHEVSSGTTLNYHVSVNSGPFSTSQKNPLQEKNVSHMVWENLGNFPSSSEVLQRVRARRPVGGS